MRARIAISITRAHATQVIDLADVLSLWMNGEGPRQRYLHRERADTYCVCVCVERGSHAVDIKSMRCDATGSVQFQIKLLNAIM